jgi:hypothetical protein
VNIRKEEFLMYTMEAIENNFPMTQVNMIMAANEENENN